MTDKLSKGLVTAAGTTTPRSLADRVLDSINLLDFGALPNQDNTLAIVDAIAVAASQNKVLNINVPSVLSSNIVLPTNITIDISTSLSLTSAVSVGITTQPVVTGNSTLTSDASEGDTVLQCSTSGMTDLAVGDYITVKSTKIFDPRTNSLEGEGAKVRAFTSSSITLDRPLTLGYMTGDSASVRTFKSNNIVIKGSGKIVGDGVTPQFGINLYNCTGGEVTGIKLESLVSGGVRYSNSLDVSIGGVSTNDHTAVTLGYGISVYGASKNVKVYNCVSSGGRHLFTTNNPAAPDAGLPIDVLVSNCLSLGTINSGDAFDTHAAALNIVFDTCISHNASASGFNFEAASGGILNCREYYSHNEGYRIRNETYYGGSFELRNNWGVGAAENGYQLGSAVSVGAVNFSDCLVRDNTYTSAGQNGMWLQDGANTYRLRGNATTLSGSSDRAITTTDLVQLEDSSEGSTQVAATSTLTVVPGETTFVINSAGTIDNLAGLAEGVPYYFRKSSNGIVVTLTEVGNITLHTGTTYDLLNSSTWILAIRTDSQVTVNPLIN